MFEGIYRIDTASVRFAFYPDGDDGARILGDISENTLRDVWGAQMCEQGLIEVCTQHFTLIEARAIAAYRTDPTRPIVLNASDFNMQAPPITSLAKTTRWDIPHPLPNMVKGLPARADGDRAPP